MEIRVIDAVNPVFMLGGFTSANYQWEGHFIQYPEVGILRTEIKPLSANRGGHFLNSCVAVPVWKADGHCAIGAGVTAGVGFFNR